MKMYYKGHGCVVEVAQIFENKKAMIYSPLLAARQQGNGWVKVSLKDLMPEEVYKEYYFDGKYVSKTERNKLKERLTLTKAVWTCTDGTDFEDCNEAIAHEKAIVDEKGWDLVNALY